MWDVSKFFDHEALSDCMNELHRSKVQGKLYRLLYEMNKNTKICVKTPVGVTDERDTGEGVGQGTLEGALVSAVSLDNGVNDFFKESEYEVSYGDIELQPLLYQDDVARMALDIESAQIGNDKMEALAETKLLDYNLEKSCFIVIGSKKTRQVMEDNLDATKTIYEIRAMIEDCRSEVCGGLTVGLDIWEIAFLASCDYSPRGLFG